MKRNTGFSGRHVPSASPRSPNVRPHTHFIMDTDPTPTGRRQGVSGSLFISCHSPPSSLLLALTELSLPQTHHLSSFLGPFHWLVPLPGTCLPRSSLVTPLHPSFRSQLKCQLSEVFPDNPTSARTLPRLPVHLQLQGSCLPAYLYTSRSNPQGAQWVLSEQMLMNSCKHGLYLIGAANSQQGSGVYRVGTITLWNLTTQNEVCAPTPLSTHGSWLQRQSLRLGHTS